MKDNGQKPKLKNEAKRNRNTGHSALAPPDACVESNRVGCAVCPAMKLKGKGLSGEKGREYPLVLKRQRAIDVHRRRHRLRLSYFSGFDPNPQGKWRAWALEKLISDGTGLHPGRIEELH